jgi:hypothetical protein
LGSSEAVISVGLDERPSPVKVWPSLVQAAGFPWSVRFQFAHGTLQRRRSRYHVIEPLEGKFRK